MFSKADTHIHTTYSDGLMSPEETIAYVAAHTDMRVIAITDHDTAEGSFAARAYAQRHAPQLEVIIGQEVSTGDGEVVGLFLKTSLPKFETAAEAIAAIHAQGGLAVAVHPFCGWHTFNNMAGVGTKIFHLPLDAVEIRNGVPLNIPVNLLTAWLNRAKGQNLPALGGSDSHVPFTVGQPFTWFAGATAADFRRAVKSGQVRPAGLGWTPLSVARLLPVLLRRGFPHNRPSEVESGVRS